jgi:molybdopterin converting factor small subunit
MPALIEFHGTQRTLTRTNRIEIPVQEDTTVRDALDYVRRIYPTLNLEEGMILITVNLEIALPDRILKDGDTISFLPIIGGG